MRSASRTPRRREPPPAPGALRRVGCSDSIREPCHAAKGDFMDIRALHREGHSIRRICALSGFSRNTVRKALREREPPRFRKPVRGSRLDPFKSYLAKRNAECALSAGAANRTHRSRSRPRALAAGGTDSRRRGEATLTAAVDPPFAVPRADRALSPPAAGTSATPPSSEREGPLDASAQGTGSHGFRTGSKLKDLPISSELVSCREHEVASELVLR